MSLFSLWKHLPYINTAASSTYSLCECWSSWGIYSCVDGLTLFLCTLGLLLLECGLCIGLSARVPADSFCAVFPGTRPEQMFMYCSCGLRCTAGSTRWRERFIISVIREGGNAWLYSTINDFSPAGLRPRSYSERLRVGDSSVDIWRNVSSETGGWVVTDELSRSHPSVGCKGIPLRTCSFVFILMHKNRHRFICARTNRYL